MKARAFFIQMQIVFRYVYLSEQEVFSEFNVPESLVWKKEGLVYGSWDQGPNSDSIFELQTQVKASESLQNNGSLYLHAFLVRAGKSPDPATGKGMFSKKWTTYKKARLNKFMKRKYKKTTNLLTGETEQSVEDQEKAEQGLTEVLKLLTVLSYLTQHNRVRDAEKSLSEITFKLRITFLNAALLQEHIKSIKMSKKHNESTKNSRSIRNLNARC